MLDIIKSSGEGSFLAVLKTFDNKKSLGLLSFPMEGTTLALDFPNKGPNTLKLFKKLDEVVMKSGGRIYMAKDNRMSREMFEAGYQIMKNLKNTLILVFLHRCQEDYLIFRNIVFMDAFA